MENAVSNYDTFDRRGEANVAVKCL
jgi:hypothetical protein